MTESEALQSSTGWIKMDDLIGYIQYREANFLVSTGKYQFKQSTPWGYVLEKVTGFAPGYGPSHEGSTRCRSGSIASGGKRAHCTCDICW